MSKAAQQATTQIVRILIKAGQAAPTPPVGPALGARGVKSMDFCKLFNAQTAHLNPGTPTPTIITIQPDRSFTFTFHTPPVTWFLKRILGVDKGASEAAGRTEFGKGKETIGTVSLKHIYEIAKIKQRDEHLKNVHLKDLAKSVMGTCRSMGIKVVA
ncbi:mitochondrial ribosomal protein L11 [Atractiella rhizophila]|nr:mitochondrial ribosomal protein L11 [Atractiella rhizophila]